MICPVKFHQNPPRSKSDHSVDTSVAQAPV